MIDAAGSISSGLRPGRTRWSDAARWAGGGLRREVFFFTSRGVELYGSLYAAAEITRPFGVVACNSWGVEADRCDPLQRSVALGMAEFGGAAMVFHYPGYGDSHGDLGEVDLGDLSAAGGDAVAEASRRCPGLTWVFVGCMLGASVALLASSLVPVHTLVLVQPALRPSAYFERLRNRAGPLAPGPAPREMLQPGEAPGMAYGYPVPPVDGFPDAEVSAELERFAGEGAVIQHAEPAGPDLVPPRFERVEVPGAWRFGSQNNLRLAAATTEWLRCRLR